MTSFAEFFGLADPNRSTFVLSPERDPSLLVGMDGLIPFLEERAQDGPTAPQAILFGEYGTGKTHALRFVEHVLAPKRRMKPVFLTLSNFGARSTFSDVHVRVMNALDESLQHMLQKWPTADHAIEANGRLSQDMKRALRLLRNPNTKPKERATARTWLMGIGPTPTQARNMGLAGRLFESAGPVELVNLWKGLGELWATAKGERLLLLLDEGESFSKVTDVQAQASLGTGLRELFDQDNAAIGIFLAANTPDVRVGVHPLRRSDFESRIGGKHFTLQGLADPVQVERFIHGWWRLIGHPGTKLLEDGAVRIISTRLRELRDVLAVRPQTASKPTQRNLMDVLAFVGRRAMEENHRPPISEVHIRSWFALKS